MSEVKSYSWGLWRQSCKYACHTIRKQKQEELSLLWREVQQVAGRANTGNAEEPAVWTKNKHSAKTNSFHRFQLLLRLNFIFAVQEPVNVHSLRVSDESQCIVCATTADSFVALVVSDWARGASILRGLTIPSFQCDQSIFFQDHLKNS